MRDNIVLSDKRLGHDQWNHIAIYLSLNEPELVNGTHILQSRFKYPDVLGKIKPWFQLISLRAWVHISYTLHIGRHSDFAGHWGFILVSYERMCISNTIRPVVS
jgi:hypothetical protein